MILASLPTAMDSFAEKKSSNRRMTIFQQQIVFHTSSRMTTSEQLRQCLFAHQKERQAQKALPRGRIDKINSRTRFDQVRDCRIRITFARYFIN